MVSLNLVKDAANQLAVDGRVEFRGRCRTLGPTLVLFGGSLGHKKKVDGACFVQNSEIYKMASQADSVSIFAEGTFDEQVHYNCLLIPSNVAHGPQ